MSKKTLVIGASEDASRYSNLAIRRLLASGHLVEALGKKGGIVQGIAISSEPKALKEVDTVTLYINPTLQKNYYDYILALHPKRVIFNPGTENEEFETLLHKNNIKAQEACTLVLLSTGQY